MLFCTYQFALFFAVVYGLYWSLRWHEGRVWLLLAASFYFYASWSPRLALLIVASTTVDYWLARGIEASSSPRCRRLLLAVNVTANLGLLCYFKYANFFLASLHQALAASGYSLSEWSPLNVLLPVG